MVTHGLINPFMHSSQFEKAIESGVQQVVSAGANDAGNTFFSEMGQKVRTKGGDWASDIKYEHIPNMRGQKSRYPQTPYTDPRNVVDEIGYGRSSAKNNVHYFDYADNNNPGQRYVLPQDEVGSIENSSKVLHSKMGNYSKYQPRGSAHKLYTVESSSYSKNYNDTGEPTFRDGQTQAKMDLNMSYDTHEKKKSLASRLFKKDK